MSTTMPDAATFVSQPGFPAGAGGANPSAPGGNGPAANMSMTSAVLWLIGGAAAVSLGAAYLGRKGRKVEFGRLDVVDSLFNAATVVVWIGTAKVLAYRFHGHKLSQAVLTVI
jgi:hypothetical protein